MERQSRAFTCTDLPLVSVAQDIDALRTIKLAELARLTHLMDLYFLVEASGGMDCEFDAHAYNAVCANKAQDLINELGLM